MDSILLHDLSEEGSSPLYLIEGAWSYHHDEVDFHACALELQRKNQE